jgi:hypothetical protein
LHWRGEVFVVRIIAACVFALVFAAACRAALAQGMWDEIDRALKQGEQHRALCAERPHDDSCKPMPASTLLFLCESRAPESFGRCHGELSAYASDGKNLDAWLCVPKDTLADFEQLRRLFVREGERMPEILNRPARLLLYYAVAKAFPCSLRAVPPTVPR